MRKTIFVVMAILAIFAIVSCDSGSSSPKVEKITITFNTQGGSSVAPVEIDKGGRLTAPTPPTKAGYEFKGWALDPDGNQMWTSSKVFSANATLYAIWELEEGLEEFSVTFEVMGGTEIDPATVLVAEGTKVNKPTPDPTKYGYTFLGWDTEPTPEGEEDSLIAPWDFDDPVTENLVLYAKWELQEGFTEVTITLVFNSPEDDLVYKVVTGAPLNKPADPERVGHTFDAWYSDITLETLYDWDADVEGDLTLYAGWILDEIPIELYDLPKFAIDLGEPTLENNASQLGWGTQGVDGKADLTLWANDVNNAQYLVLDLKNEITGGVQIIWQGTGNSWGWAQEDIVSGDGTPAAGKGVTYDYKGDVIQVTIELSKALKDYNMFNNTQVKFFIAYYTPDFSGLGLLRAYLILKPYEAGPDPDNTTQLIEKVTLANSNQVVYKFDLPANKKWSDYKGVRADYMLANTDDFKVSNSGRAIRLYGNYALDFFHYNETDAGNKYYYASLDGPTNNNAYILDDPGAGGWRTLEDALKLYFGNEYEPEGGKWFGIEYRIDGSRSNQKPHPHMPEDSDRSLIFGLGLPGQDDANEFYMTNVVLLAKSGADLPGYPLFVQEDANDPDSVYPVFSAYGTASGNGVDLLSRINSQGDYPTPTLLPTVEERVTVTFDLNTPEEAEGTPEFEGGFAGTIHIVKGESVEPLPEATLEGYIFLGWALTAAGTDAIAESHVFNADTTVYAIWVPEGTELVTITFDLNSPDSDLEPEFGDGLNTYSKDIVSGAAIGELPEPAELEGYIFLGWALSATATVADVTEATTFEADATVYAVWAEEGSEEQVTITFNFNVPDEYEGEDDPAFADDFEGTITIVKGEAIGELPTAILEGYTFIGWALTNDATATDIIDENETFDDDAILYAVWEEET